MKSYKSLFVKTEKVIALRGAEKPVSLLRKEYESEVLSAVYSAPLAEAMKKLSLVRRLFLIQLYKIRLAPMRHSEWSGVAAESNP